MKYINAGDDAFLKFDPDTNSCEVMSLKSLTELSNKLKKNLPQIPDDKELLRWAKENYPGLKDVGNAQKRVDEVEEEIKQLTSAKMI